MMALQASLFSDTPQAYEIVFDGGSLGNPGKGYGSYEITADGKVLHRERKEYGDNITNNQAEYQTLIEALSWLAARLGPAAAHSRVTVLGDSQLVLNQILGRWKVKNDGLRPLHRQASDLVAGFGEVDLTWHARSNSVMRLGH